MYTEKEWHTINLNWITCLLIFVGVQIVSLVALGVPVRLGEICKKTLADKIYKNDIKRKRERELLHIYELLNLVVTENFNTI